jgi:tryptophan-rich sensory protein
MHQVSSALFLLVAIFVAALATTLMFGRIRPAAAWLMVPYLVWLCFAGVLNWEIDRLNPNASTLVPSSPSAQMNF